MSFPGVGTRHAWGVRYSGEKTQSKGRRLDSDTSCPSGPAKVDRAMEVRRSEMACAVAFLRGEGGQWLTTSSRYSRKKISDRSWTLEGEVTIALYLSVRISGVIGGPHICHGGSDKKAEVRT